MRAAISTVGSDPQALLSRVLASPPMARRRPGRRGVHAPSRTRCPPPGDRVRYRSPRSTSASRPRRRGRWPQRGCEVHVLPGHQHGGRRSWPPARTGCSSPTAPATRPPPTTRSRPMRGVLAAAVPLFGICFGNQILGRALGLGTYKLRFGHRGINQPVQDLRHRPGRDHRHNHGFAVALPRDGGAGAGRRCGARRSSTGRSAAPRSATSASTTAWSRAAAAGRARVLRAVPPGGRGRPARRGLPVRRVLRPDGAGR